MRQYCLNQALISYHIVQFNMEDKFAEYQLPTTAYMNFDAESLRDFIVSRLSEQQVFTDQIYKGSNLSAFIDIIAYSYHTLLYYLNRTSTESLFTETSIYENINRIVKLLNYSPLGYQTSTLSFQARANDDLVPGTYTLPRYTYVNANDITYSLDTDVSFTKNTPAIEPIAVIGEKYLLYQGEWKEHTQLTAIGQDFETTVLVPTEATTKIDHFHVHVYVKNIDTGIYHEYKEVPSLYLASPTDKVFEKRLNENEAYELKFGNNITGARLETGDTIQIYYLESKGEDGVVGAGFLDDLKIVPYTTTIFNKIQQDIKPDNTQFITFDNIETLSFTNVETSTKPQVRETVDEMKRKAPIHLISQDRLVTLNEFQTHVDKNFGNMLTSSKCVDNDTFMDNHMRYLTEDIGIEYPNLESRVMYNHLQMSTSTQFNNIYVYGVPKMSTNTSTTVLTNFLTPAQKELMINDMRERKMISHEIVIMDPVYVATNLGLASANETLTPAVVDNTKLRIYKQARNTRDPDAIIGEVVAILLSYFDNTNCDLGQVVELTQVGASMLEIEGVESIATVRTDVELSMPGLSLAFWNPVYPVDILTTTQNYQLPIFKFPYVHDSFNLFKKIEVVS